MPQRKSSRGYRPLTMIDRRTRRRPPEKKIRGSRRNWTPKRRPRRRRAKPCRLPTRRAGSTEVAPSVFDLKTGKEQRPVNDELRASIYWCATKDSNLGPAD